MMTFRCQQSYTSSRPCFFSSALGIGNPHPAAGRSWDRKRFDKMAESNLLPQVYKLWKYSYYDTPEGEDVFKKMFCATKWATIAGGTIALYDISLYKRLTKVGPILARTGYWVGPYALMGLTFSSVPVVLKDLRKKDDYWNNAIGGFVTGMVMGGMRQNNAAGAIYGIILSVFAVFFNVAAVHEWRKDAHSQDDKFGKWKREYGSFDHWKNDWTYTEDPRDRKQKS